MANPEERARRSKQAKINLEKNANDPEVKRKLSESAKKTSARPEIIAQRTAQLQRWRVDNPEEFATKCTAPMLAARPETPTWFSKPEKMLLAFVQTIEGFTFQFNQVIKSANFDWQSQRKQVDIGDKSQGIYLEYDGPFHFESWGNPDKLNETKWRDYLLNEHIVANGLILIRISYDQFIGHNEKQKFAEGCLEQVRDIILARKPGLYKIGSKYEQHKEYQVCR